MSGAVWTVKIGSDNGTGIISSATLEYILAQFNADGLGIVKKEKVEGLWKGAPEEVLYLAVEVGSKEKRLFDLLKRLIVALNQEAIGIIDDRGAYRRVLLEQAR